MPAVSGIARFQDIEAFSPAGLSCFLYRGKAIRPAFGTHAAAPCVDRSQVDRNGTFEVHRFPQSKDPAGTQNAKYFR